MKTFILDTFNFLHAHPELGFKEVVTSTYLADKLESFGYTVTRNVGTTGVVGVLDSGVAGEHLCLRADMDALPFKDGDKDICIHACGHDAHSTMVLSAAKVIAEKGIKTGKLYILFQQAEERTGAVEMTTSPIFKDIDTMFGLHLRPESEAKLGEAVSGLSHSAGYFVTIDIGGLASHGSRPFLGVNAINIATGIINGVNAIHEDVTVPYSVKPTQIVTIGNPPNTVPDTCKLTFDIRSQKNEVADNILAKVKQIAYATAEAFGGTIKDISVKGVPAAELDPELTKVCEEAIVEELGSCLGFKETVGGEDIHYFTKINGIRIGYMGVGANLKMGLHHREMHFDTDCLEVGMKLLINVTNRRIGVK